LAEWEKKGKVHHHVTQNVDSLLVKAGCNKLTELHGTSYKVVCINCNFRMTRESMQILIKSVNPNWNVFSEDLNPDNDVRLSEEQMKEFTLPKCPCCNQDKLKPDLGINLKYSNL
jgi:NAD-dependent deacetylase sirtuin 4